MFGRVILIFLILAYSEMFDSVLDPNILIIC